MQTTTRFLSVIALLIAAPVFAADESNSDLTIREDVVYGHKDGLALTFDVLQPKNANGGAVLWLQSGGWYSGWAPVKNLVPASRVFLDKGLTVFIVRHGSAPRYAIPDAVADVRRCVRFIRMKADEFGVDADRLGVTGGSAGGHLSLVLGTTADDGDPKASDEVLKHSSRVAAVVALYPPTDIRTWVTDPPSPIKDIPALKPPLTFDPAKAADFSPLLHVDGNDAPTLLIHGDKDQLVPIEHSHQFVKAMEEKKMTGELMVIEGAGHSYTAEQNKRVIPAMVGWFEKHLAKKD